jgi:surface protein
MEEVEQPLAKRPKTEEQEDEGTTTTSAADDHLEATKNYTSSAVTSILDLLRSLPANVVAHYVYPLAVQVIKNREELIEAVDEHLNEFYSDDDGEAENDNEDVENNRIRYRIGDWDVSGVNDFTSVFDKERNGKAKNFNEDLSRWNVANGTSFARMFLGCHFFQYDLSNWNTCRATDLSNMFNGCTSFQSDVSRWNVASTTDLSFMFFSCTSFNSDVY